MLTTKVSSRSPRPPAHTLWWRLPTHVHKVEDSVDFLERMFPDGLVFAATLVQSQQGIDDLGINAAAHMQRAYKKKVASWSERPHMVDTTLAALAVYHRRSSDYSPAEEVNTSWVLEGASPLTTVFCSCTGGSLGAKNLFSEVTYSHHASLDAPKKTLSLRSGKSARMAESRGSGADCCCGVPLHNR